jgi:opacity protein-like surface antigen
MKKLLMCTALLGAMMATAAQADDRPAGVKVGTLTCHEAGGWGFVFGSSRHVRCVFANANNKSERYEGEINKFGVDVGYQQSAVVVWSVIAPTDHLGRGDLAGHYGGAAASAAAGVGVGANVLIGGFNKSFTLQPVSIEGETGLNLAAGIAELTLKTHHKPS